METLDKHFRTLTREVFARYGFAYGEVIARWPEIVGEVLAPVCQPQRIRWPRGLSKDRATGGTLIIEAAPGRALELQYEVPRIIERVNAFYGHGAIAAVRIIQGAAAPASPPRRAAAAPPPALVAEAAAVEDPALRAALQRLAAGVARRSQSSPQGKE